jgi:hypothetical protein
MKENTHYGRDAAVPDESRRSAREQAMLRLAQESRNDLIDHVLSLQERKHELKTQIEHYKKVVEYERAWNQFSLTFLLAGVFFAVLLIEEEPSLPHVAFALVESAIFGAASGFLLISAQRKIRAAIFRRFRRTKPAQIASYMMLFAVSAVVIFVAWFLLSLIPVR